MSRSGVPYHTRRAMLDLMAQETDKLMAARAFVLELEARMLQTCRLLDQVSRGQYEDEQVAPPRLKVSRE